MRRRFSGLDLRKYIICKVIVEFLLKNGFVVRTLVEKDFRIICRA